MNKETYKIVIKGYIYNDLKALKILSNTYDDLPFDLQNEITEKEFNKIDSKITPKTFALYTSKSQDDVNLLRQINKTLEFKDVILEIEELINNRKFTWNK